MGSNKPAKQPLVIPDGFDEIVKKINSLLASKYVFGIYEKEDIEQEIYLFCYDALTRYDKSRNLYNFLFTHVKNRLQSLKRDKFFRWECPCKLCDFKEDGNTGHNDSKYCEIYKEWFKTNSRKANLARPIGFADKFDVVDSGKDSYQDIDTRDFLEKVDKEMPINLRGIYLKMKSGVNVSNCDKQKVLNFLSRYTDTI